MSPISMALLLFILTCAVAKLNPIHRDFIKAVNQVRRSKGLKPVCLAEKLNSAALEHSRWMGKNKKLTHGGDSNLKNRILKTKYRWNGAAAENIAQNSALSAKNAVNQWIKSPKHYATMISSKYNQVGVGAFEEKGKVWWTMVMAKGSDTCALS